MKSVIVCVVGMAVLAGCAGKPLQQEETPKRASALTSQAVMTALENVQAKKASELDEPQRAALQSALTSMEEFCTPRLTAMEKDASRKANNAFWLSVAGALSGAVIAPALTAGNAAAHSSAIAAFSGFGGATNFLSQSLASSGNSGSADATTRNAIVTTIWQKLNEAFDEQKSIGQRLGAVDAAKAACVFYSIQVPAVPALPATK